MWYKIVKRCMKEKITEASRKGEEVAKKYNAETQIPFPFEEIANDCGDLDIFLADLHDVSPGEHVSGLILFREQEEKFKIIVDENKPKNRQYFTIAHELGHYFLHKGPLKEKQFAIDGDPTLYRSDNGLTNIEETQANHFAASLLMPAARVEEVWGKVRSVERCAEFFHVSVSAMGIRLEILKLV